MSELPTGTVTVIHQLRGPARQVSLAASIRVLAAKTPYRFESPSSSLEHTSAFQKEAGPGR
jgi:hypothetical protein